MAFDKPFGDLIDDEDNHGYLKAIVDATPILILFTIIPEVHKFLEKSRIMNFLVPSARDKTGLGKVIDIAQQKVDERFGPNRKRIKTCLVP